MDSIRLVTLEFTTGSRFLNTVFISLAFKFQLPPDPRLGYKNVVTLLSGKPKSQKNCKFLAAYFPQSWMYNAIHTSCTEREFCGGQFYIPMSFVFIQPNGKFHNVRLCILRNHIMRAVREKVKQTKIILEHCLVSDPLRHSSNFSFFSGNMNFSKQSLLQIIRNLQCHTSNPLCSEAL